MTGILIDLTPWMFKGFRVQLFEQTKDVINHKSKNNVHYVNSDIAYISYFLFPGFDASSCYLCEYHR